MNEKMARQVNKLIGKAMKIGNRSADVEWCFTIKYKDFVTRQHRLLHAGESAILTLTDLPTTNINPHNRKLPVQIRDILPNLSAEITMNVEIVRDLIGNLVKMTEKRGKPRWSETYAGKFALPVWWPTTRVPWPADLKRDPRKDSEYDATQNPQVSSTAKWTELLMFAVRGCYKHYKCLDLFNGKWQFNLFSFMEGRILECIINGIS